MKIKKVIFIKPNSALNHLLCSDWSDGIGNLLCKDSGFTDQDF